MKHATPQPFQQYRGNNNELKHLNPTANKTDNSNIEEESNHSTIEIATNDQIDMAYAVLGASNEGNPNGFLTPVILPETTLHFPSIKNK